MQYKNSHTLSISLRVHIHAKLALYQLYLLLLMLLVDCTGPTVLPLLCLESSNGDGLKLTIISIITQLQQDHEDSFLLLMLLLWALMAGDLRKLVQPTFTSKVLLSKTHLHLLTEHLEVMLETNVFMCITILVGN